MPKDDNELQLHTINDAGVTFFLLSKCPETANLHSECVNGRAKAWNAPAQGRFAGLAFAGGAAWSLAAVGAAALGWSIVGRRNLSVMRSDSPIRR